MLSFKDVAPSFIVAFPGGYEIHQGKPYIRYNPKTHTQKVTNQVQWQIGYHIPVETRKNARFYIKGLQKLFANAKSKHFFEGVAEQIHGNTNTVKSKYEKLVRCLSCAQIVSIGQGATFTVESYVNGDYSVTVY